MAKTTVKTETVVTLDLNVEEAGIVLAALGEVNGTDGPLAPVVTGIYESLEEALGGTIFRSRIDWDDEADEYIVNLLRDGDQWIPANASGF